MKPDEKIMARLKPGCICMGIRLDKILKAIEEGARSFDDVARTAGIGRGDCGGRRCREKVETILRKTANRDRA